jgi:PBP1b-binding outer membrane lipoprotein LpoB
MARIILLAISALFILSCGNANNPDPYTKDSTAGKTNTVSGTPDTLHVTDTGVLRRDTLR